MAFCIHFFKNLVKRLRNRTRFVSYCLRIYLMLSKLVLVAVFMNLLFARCRLRASFGKRLVLLIMLFVPSWVFGNE
jgi:hypothetical protein